MVHYLLVGVSGFVTGVSVEPGNYLRNGLRYVLHIKLEVRKIADGVSLIKVRDVNEVPVFLVGATFVFYVISKSYALDE